MGTACTICWAKKNADMYRFGGNLKREDTAKKKLT
jgi:hypothetical protein